MDRKIVYGENEICYVLERKDVKNLNLRIKKDCSIYVSANPLVAVESVDSFVLGKAEYIATVLKKYEEVKKYTPQPKQYISGETFMIQGRGHRLVVREGSRNEINSDGVHIFVTVKDASDDAERQKMVQGYLTRECRVIFTEVLDEIYPIFRKYDVPMPKLRIRDMETRWGSCLARKGVITLNRRLLEAPRNGIEYVVMHEMCHFIHPNHSKKFYAFLTMLMPDWKERKKELDKCAEYWL